MRIAVEASCWALPRGYGRHLRGLVGAFVERFPRHEVVLVTDGPESSGFPLPQGAEVVRVATTARAVDAASAETSRSLADMWRMGRAMARTKADVLLFPTVYSFAPVLTRTPVAVFIHDVIAESFPEAVFANQAAQRRWDAKVWLAKISADRILTVSDYARRTIAEMLGLPVDRIAVVGEAPDQVFRPIAPADLPLSLSEAGVSRECRQIVYVGGFGAHKNLPRLLEAFARLVSEPRFADLQLVLVGDPSRDSFLHEWEAVQQSAAALGTSVVLPGFVADGDLARLLNVAKLLVLPSLMEGYGLPAVEAAACGCAVAVTRHSAIPEVLRQACKTFDPFDIIAITEAMRTALLQRERLSQAAAAKVQELTWVRAAQELERVLSEIAETRR